MSLKKMFIAFKTLLKKFHRQGVSTPDTDFDYGTLADYFGQRLDEHTAHHSSLPDDNRIISYRPLFDGERKHILRAFFTSINKKAHQLDKNNSSLGDDSIDIPRKYRLKVESVDKKDSGGFLDNIKVRYGDAKEPFDNEEGTITILDSPLAARRQDGLVKSDGVLVEQIGEEEYLMTLLWLNAERFEETTRSLRIDGRNPAPGTDSDIFLEHNLCMGRNLLCGKNGGASSAGKNVIRITSEKIPSPAAEIDVQSNNDVFITVTDDKLYAVLDERPLKYREKVPFPIGKVLNLGICSLKLQ